MANVYPEAWVNTSAYSTGDIREDGGVSFRATSDIPAGSESAPNTRPSEAPTLWQIVGVVRIVDHYSLIQACILSANTSAPETVASIPMLLQIAEQEVYQRVHPPVERTFITLTADTMGRLTLPNNINKFVHVRRKADTGMVGEHVEILETDTTRFYQARFQNVDGFVGAGLSYAQVAFGPVYIYDNKYMYFEGFEAENGDEFELFVELALPALGLTITDPADQMLKVVTSNWYSTNAPRAMYFGTNLQIALFNKDDEGAARWKTLFDEAIQRLVIYLDEFQASDKTDQYQNSEYFD